MKLRQTLWVALAVFGMALAGCEARVNRERDNFGFLEIHKAARDGNTALVQQLIQNGAKVNMADLDGITPLHSAAKNNNVELATVLLKNHADPSILTTDGWDALHLATWRENAEMVDLLLSYGATANRKTMERGWTVVHMAAFKGNTGILDTINREWPAYQGVKPALDELDAEGNAPIHLAIAQGKLDVVNYLVGKGADKNIADANGNTPLHLVIPTGDVERVRYLVMLGANVNARNKAGKTPYTVCADHNNAPMAEIIIAAGGTQ